MTTSVTPGFFWISLGILHSNVLLFFLKSLVLLQHKYSLLDEKDIHLVKKFRFEVIWKVYLLHCISYWSLLKLTILYLC